MYTATVNAKTKLHIRLEGDTVHVNENQVEVSKAQLTELRSHWIVNGKSMNVELVQVNTTTKEFTVKVNNRPYTLQLKDRYDDLLKSLGMEAVGEKKMREIKAPMPGMVLNVLVKEGDIVEKDTPILILEAMKMENVIKSAASAVVKKVRAVKGVAVEKNAVLVEFE
jgi:biotin carboxyl carrier protein